MSSWVDQKIVVHLHPGILCRKKKERAPTIQDSMDGTGEHYAKWNKPGGERQIRYDLTYKWNLMNKTNKWAKYNQRHGNNEQSDSEQRGVVRGITGEIRGRFWSRNMYKGPMVMDNRVQTDWGSQGDRTGKKLGQL